MVKENEMTEKAKSDKSEKKDRPGTVVVHASTIEIKPSPDPKTKTDERKK